MTQLRYAQGVHMISLTSVRKTRECAHERRQVVLGVGGDAKEPALLSWIARI